MKKFVLIGILLLSSGILYSQRDDRFYLWPEDTATNKYIFTEVVYTPRATALALYTSAKEFAGTYFKKVTDTLLFENDTTYTVAFKASYPVVVPQLAERGKGYVSFLFSLECYSNGYKYTMTNFQHEASSLNGVIGGELEHDKTVSGGMAFPRKYWEEVKENCYYTIQMTIEQLKEFMLKHSYPKTS